jgi:Ni/Co efflux regulator RcnB
MKYMITAAVALTLLASGGAMAQDDHHRDGGGRGGGDRGGDRGGFRGGPQGGQPAPAQAAPPQQDFQRGVPRNRAGQEVFQGNRGQGGPPPQQNFDRGNRGQNFQGQTFDRGQQRDQYRGRGDQRRYDGGRQDYRGGGNDRRYDRGGHQDYRPGGYLRDRGWREGQRFHVSPYRYPRGFGYQTWAFGAFLPGAFLAPDYTLWDYWVYGLPAPPPGFHWIRVGPDALLVRYGDGYVLDAAYGLFY